MHKGLPTTPVGAMLCLVTVTVVAAACGRGATTATPPTPATVPIMTTTVDQGTTPSGWVPITFGTAEIAQIAVPADWVTATADCPYGSAPGMVIVRDVASVTGCVQETGPPISNVVGITPESPPLLRPAGKHTSINGITVFWGQPTNNSIGYQVPSLGVQIDATGHLGPEVLATLTRPKSL